MAIRLKSTQDLEKMRAAGRIVRSVLNRCSEMCKPGVTTREIDEEAYRIFTEAGAKGLFKNYPTYRPGEGFPGNICVSVNEEVVHGIAGDRVIKDGDVVGIDCGVEFEGWCGDSAVTVPVGNVSPEVQRLLDVTKQVLEVAVKNIQPGRRWSQVARLMQQVAEDAGLGVVKEFVGHGIGQKMHEEPKVPNYVSPELLRHDILLREGVVMAIEPMCNLGTDRVITKADGWTVVTADGKPSAHFEHTVAVTAGGGLVLTDGS